MGTQVALTCLLELYRQSHTRFAAIQAVMLQVCGLERPEAAQAPGRHHSHVAV